MKVDQEYIKEVFDMEAGGGCVVDFVRLSDGRVLGINGECIVLYENIEHFMDGRSDISYSERMIEVPSYPPKPQKPKLFLCHWINPQYEDKWAIKKLDFFVDERGYEVDDQVAIEGLEVDTADRDTWEGDHHTVRRIQ